MQSNMISIVLLCLFAFARTQTVPQMVQPDDTAGPFIKLSVYQSERGPAWFLDKVTISGISSGPAQFRAFQDANLRIVCPALAVTQSTDTNTGGARFYGYTRGELIYDPNHQVWAAAEGNGPFIINDKIDHRDIGSPLASSTTVCFVYDIRRPLADGKSDQKEEVTTKSHGAELIQPDLARGEKFILAPYRLSSGYIGYYLAHATRANIVLSPVRFTQVQDQGGDLFCPEMVAHRGDVLDMASFVHDRVDNVWSLGYGTVVREFLDITNTTDVFGPLYCMRKY